MVVANVMRLSQRRLAGGLAMKTYAESSPEGERSSTQDGCHKHHRSAYWLAVGRRGCAAGMSVVAMLGSVWGVWSTVASASERANLPTYYVSIGDSYPAGYRPDGNGSGSTSRDAFVYQVQDKLTQRGGDWTTVNFACSGETVYAMSFERGCLPQALAPDGIRYPDTPQSIAAIEFIETHREQIGLVTIVMGGNDAIRCIDEQDAVKAQHCAEVEIAKVLLGVGSLLSRIRSAVGSQVPIVGASYINVFVADRLVGSPKAERRADFAVALFKNYLNPALRQSYSRYGAAFVDTTALAGGDLPATDKSALPGGKTVQASIGRVCALSYYCSQGDPHPNRAGHALIADEIERLIG
jgi:lysophospholipase L1-like esterase